MGAPEERGPAGAPARGRPKPGSPAPGEPAPAGGEGPGELAALSAELRERLARLEHLAGRGVVGAQQLRGRSARRPESRWPVTAAVVVAIGLQVALPARLMLGPRALLPALEGALAVLLAASNPSRVVRHEGWVRAVSVSLVALTSVANAYASGALIHAIVARHAHVTAVELLAQGASIYLTNIIVFALWYWEWDAGGPIARLHGERPFPDFLFPQMGEPQVAPPGWRPRFPDYLYLSYTNATAFSPTDVMPLAHWAKLLMGLQSAVALLTIGLVVARAVNILP